MPSTNEDSLIWTNQTFQLYGEFTCGTKGSNWKDSRVQNVPGFTALDNS